MGVEFLNAVILVSFLAAFVLLFLRKIGIIEHYNHGSRIFECSYISVLFGRFCAFIFAKDWNYRAFAS
nr:MAG TPA: hypothetical protein [Caudoviricetes sp.]